VSYDVGVPQGPVLGPSFLVTYVSPLSDINTWQVLDSIHRPMIRKSTSPCSPPPSVNNSTFFATTPSIYIVGFSAMINAEYWQVRSSICQSASTTKCCSHDQLRSCRWCRFADFVRTKITGNIIDNQLSFNRQVRAVQLPKTSAVACQTSVVIPGSSHHGLQVWDTASINATLYCTVQIKHYWVCRAFRAVLQVQRQTHALLLLHQLHWLPDEHRTTYKTALLTS